MNKTLETYARIDNYMEQPIRLLESLGQTEDAKTLKVIQRKYRRVIDDYLIQNNIPKMTFRISRGYEVEYTRPGATNGK